MENLNELAKRGALEGGGNRRLAMSDEDGAGRDYVVSRMKALGLKVVIDRVGNVVATRPGRMDGPPVMTGSHVDTVGTGGIYDGALGVLAGLEVVETLNDHDVATDHPIAVAFFSNEEGVRFTPDMMGSQVFAGTVGVPEALDAIGFDGTRYGDELERIGYAGDAECGVREVRSFLELHIEQGPVLDSSGIDIGVVEGVQGLSWTEWSLEGVANHAGTTPMEARHDAGYGAAEITSFARRMAREMGGRQVATVGVIDLHPNLINVVAETARVTVDLRNTDDLALADAETRMTEFVKEMATEEGLKYSRRTLARFAPVPFAPPMVDLIEAKARGRGSSTHRMPSGAGHDAQMLAAICPTAMIFVPSRDGISHNVNEFTEPRQIEAGANVLLDAMLELSGADSTVLDGP
jgi:N-carbamoyl-L-amino-acid hydrolase